MDFISTRGSGPVSGARAIVDGIAKDGGLYVPSFFPQLSTQDIVDMEELDYAERSAYIMSLYLTDFTYEELLVSTRKAYAKFDGDAAPLVKIDDGVYILELWHGPTLAFKDIALTVLPYLMVECKKKLGNDSKTLILVATSGDTGKAALEGFKDVEGTEIMVFYPSDGVSAMQKLQMSTTDGKNTHVIAIEGNFDDAQTAVKQVFANKNAVEKLKQAGYELSSANSINFGRLVPQVVYYVSSYVDLVSSGQIENGDGVNFIVPTGNFGNILAGYYAKKMGVPIANLVVASNANNVLTEFFEEGIYDANRDFHKTMSPSMDILVSSNLERLLFEFSSRNPLLVCDYMEELRKSGYYTVNMDELCEELPEFFGYSCTEAETSEIIDNFFDEYGYLVDTHTAVAVSALFKFINDTFDGEEQASIVVSTANPYKFPQDVYKSVAHLTEDNADKAVKKLNFFTGMEIPAEISELKNKQILHDKIIKKDAILESVLGIIGISE